MMSSEQGVRGVMSGWSAGALLVAVTRSDAVNLVVVTITVLGFVGWVITSGARTNRLRSLILALGGPRGRPEGGGGDPEVRASAGESSSGHRKEES